MTLNELYGCLETFDFWFDMSDDYSVVLRGREAKERLMADIRAMGKEAEDLWEEWKDYMAGGPKPARPPEHKAAAT